MKYILAVISWLLIGAAATSQITGPGSLLGSYTAEDGTTLSLSQTQVMLNGKASPIWFEPRYVSPTESNGMFGSVYRKMFVSMSGSEHASFGNLLLTSGNPNIVVLIEIFDLDSKTGILEYTMWDVLTGVTMHESFKKDGS